MPDVPSSGPGPAPAEVEDTYAKSRERLARPLGGGERLIAATLGGTFLLAALALPFATSSPRSPSLILAAVLVLAFAALANVEFEVGAGSAIPTQLIFVPMLFLLPLGWVPLAVAAGNWVSLNADVVRGRRHRERVVVLLSSCWYVLGPVAVLLAWGEGPPRWDRWPVYVAALLAQFGADLASTLIRERRALGITLRRLAPMAAIAYGVDAALAPLGLLAAFAAIEMSYAFVLLLPVAVLLAIFARERAQRLEQEAELNVAYRRTMLLLGDIIESDDAYTGSHSRGVVELVSEVAEVLHLSAGERTQAEFTALLHDVGKIRIPKELIQKPEPLTPEERTLIETHTVEGQLILKQVGGSLEEVGNIVRSCHEWWNGKGYPDRLAGEQIPLVARIVCCCDAYSAMTTDRPYRAALTPEAAVAELRACAGSQFDPRVVEALLRVLGAAGEPAAELPRAA